MTFTNPLTLIKSTAGVILLALFLCPASASAQPEYRITDLGSIEGASDEVGAMAINDRGQVAGGNGHAFLWTNGIRDLGTLRPQEYEDSTFAVANDVNNQGVLVGCSGSFKAVFGTGLETARGIVVKNNHLQQFSGYNVSFIPYAINDAGQIAGLNAFRGFFYAQGKMIPIGTFSHVPNGNRSTARGLNSRGQVVGWSTVGYLPVAKFDQLATHAFLWQRHGKSGRMRDLGTLPGWVSSYAYKINRQSEIVGSVSDAGGDTDGFERASRTAAFLWRSGKMVSLGTLPGSKNSAAFGINDSTEIAGTSDARAFLWTQGKILDLNACLPAASGWTLEEARAINNKGQIVGNGKLNGQEHMFLLTPTAPQ